MPQLTREQQTIEGAFKLLNREVWVVTAQGAHGILRGQRGGLTASWVSQASLDPQRPVMVAGIAPNHFTAELIEASGCFALHLLNFDQTSMALDFAIGSGRTRDKLIKYDLLVGASGTPILKECLAWFDCRVIDRRETGDRIYYWAEVLDGGKTFAARDSENHPLREQELFEAATSEQKQALRRNLVADIEIQSALVEKWRAQLTPTE
jgi:flavin reductase (DIM6/NTAB) family NADH-FMN oxidoreductase RutF